ncbi:hypothetical protein [Rothia sp. P5766]|uniref:hypothetical protein n=1 Tax=unclassified Rothia (in: high G+C Gram-positive bacteria) TaxID=2689056 RepID=UPI003AEDF583
MAKKKPADRKPSSKKLLTIDTPAGEVNIKPFKVKVGFLRKNRKEDETELMFKIIEMHADEEALEVIDELTFEDLKEFFVQWQEASGVDLGES